MRAIFLLLTTLLTLPYAGHSVAAGHDASQAMAPRQQVAESILADIDQATWISEGKGPGVIYIFFDSDCPYCHKLYLNTRDWITNDQVTLRWIPVGILTTTSEGKAYAMLGADDPLQAFYENEDNYSRGGGIAEDLATPELTAKLRANEALLARTPTSAVPAMVFRAKGGAPILITGAPPKDKMPVILRNLDTAAGR